MFNLHSFLLGRAAVAAVELALMLIGTLAAMIGMTCGLLALPALLKILKYGVANPDPVAQGVLALGFCSLVIVPLCWSAMMAIERSRWDD